MKEIDLRFVMNHTPLEYRDTVHMIAEGKFNCGPLLSGEVGLAGVDNAFTALKDPESYAKILINPKSAATQPAPVRL
jgi:threonine dehydrogenase-like Zn-dependent dehydrogenase